MIFRELLEGDSAEWWRLRLEALEREPFAFGKSGEELRATPVEVIANRFRGVPAGGRYLGAFKDGSLIGMATFLRETGMKARHKGRVYGVYVTMAARSRGVGRLLMTALLDSARRDESLEQILISVAATQTAARRLYRSLGFQTYGTEPRARKAGERYIDEDHMILQIR